MRRDRIKVAAAFGRALRRYREQEGLSQEELAFRAKVDRTFVSRAERGERQPALTTILLLARALRIEAASLVAAAEREISGGKGRG